MIDFKELPQNGTKFEQLTRELAIRSGFEVHWTGVGQDGGRDLVITEKAEGALAPFERKWLVSCKHNAHSGKSVGLADIANVTDACAAVGASGFLLACSTQPTSTVVNRLQEIAANGGLLTTYWDGIEFEKRLNTPSTLPLIHLFFPESSKSIGWNIYNKDSPSFWAANYKDYYIYLSSRTSNSFPDLTDVEEILQRLESIPLPEGSDWKQHYIRPRGVYFDNKHEQFVVFADYLYPIGEEERVLLPHVINETLRDGDGLYSDNFATWKLTHWDVEYIESNQTSDHFHLDHKDYYEKHIDNFRIGMCRDSFICDKHFFARNVLLADT